MLQHTLAAEIVQTGVGLHSGVETCVRLLPADLGSGRYFVRVDLPDLPVIPAKVTAVNQTVMSTQLGQGEICVRTVEHLLAALAGMGVDNVRIEIDGSEVPLLDGSAAVWTKSISEVGLTAQSDDHHTTTPLIIKQPIWVHQDDAFICAIPSPITRFTYGIDFPSSSIGNQWYSFSLGQSCEENGAGFGLDIAPARAFVLLHQIEHLQKSGLIKGGNLENALVCGPEGWLNPPLRFVNEPVRHKILDLIGDLSLLGTFPIAHFLAYKASHTLHNKLAYIILELV